jgi:hypothetical protein
MKGREGEMIRKICTHEPPRHLDDFFAVSFLKFLFSQADLEYLHPQEVPREYLEDPSVILVDVGRSYDPEKNNFDHHHDVNVRCSLFLVLERFSDDVDENHPVVLAIDCIDRFGFVKAFERFGVSPSDRLNEMKSTILLLDVEKHYGEIVRCFLSALECTERYDEFIGMVYACLDSKNLLNEPKEVILARKRQLENILSKLKIFRVGSLKIGYVAQVVENVREVLDRFRIDVLVCKNSLNANCTSIIKNVNSLSASTLDLHGILGKEKIAFNRSENPVVVLEVPVEKLSVRELVRFFKKTLKNVERVDDRKPCFFKKSVHLDRSHVKEKKK